MKTKEEFRREKNELQRKLAFKRAAKLGRMTPVRNDFAVVREFIDDILAWKVKHPTPSQIEKKEQREKTRKQLGRAMALLRRFNRGRDDLFDLRADYKTLEKEVLGQNVVWPPVYFRRAQESYFEMEARARKHWDCPPGYAPCTREWPHDGPCAHPLKSPRVDYQQIPPGESRWRIIPPDWAEFMRQERATADALKPHRWYIVDDTDTGDFVRVLARTGCEALSLGGQQMPDSRRRYRLRARLL